MPLLVLCVCKWGLGTGLWLIFFHSLVPSFFHPLIGTHSLSSHCVSGLGSQTSPSPGPCPLRASLLEGLVQPFSNSALVTIWASYLCCEGCPVHCRMFSSVPGLHPLAFHQVVTTKNVSRYWQMSPQDAKLPLVEDHWSKCYGCAWMCPCV